MTILSISMDRRELKHLEKARKKLGFRSRSKMLRSAIDSLIKEYEGLDSFSGNVESVFVLSYGEPEKNRVSDIIHGFDSAIKAELHHHHPGMCIDILNLETTANRTREFFAAVKKSRSIFSVTYSIIKEHK